MTYKDLQKNLQKHQEDLEVLNKVVPRLASYINDGSYTDIEKYHLLRKIRELLPHIITNYDREIAVHKHFTPEDPEGLKADSKSFNSEYEGAKEELGPLQEFKQ